MFHLLNKDHEIIVLILTVCVYYLLHLVSDLLLRMIASDDSSDGVLSLVMRKQPTLHDS